MFVLGSCVMMIMCGIFSRRVPKSTRSRGYTECIAYIGRQVDRSVRRIEELEKEQQQHLQAIPKWNLCALKCSKENCGEIRCHPQGTLSFPPQLDMAVA